MPNAHLITGTVSEAIQSAVTKYASGSTARLSNIIEAARQRSAAIAELEERDLRELIQLAAEMRGITVREDSLPAPSLNESTADLSAQTSPAHRANAE